MGYELIVTEKPSQAKKIAESLANSKPIVKKEGQVSYYIVTHGKQDIVVAAAVGHVYSLAESEKSYVFPSFTIDWKPAYAVDKGASHTKKYLDVIKKLAKDAETFTVGTDFDVEGEVIGWNLIRFACKQKDAQRMKFSTLTKPDLIKSYENKLKTIEWGQAHAGETRHKLDWLYGINLSRALSTAIRKAGLYKTLSSGRVQGPALKLLVDKEKEIRKFIPVPYWQIAYTGMSDGKTLEGSHVKDKFWDEEEAKQAFSKVNGHDGTVAQLETRETKSQPPTPFDLTTLQTEAFRSLKIKPKDTLAIAQDLYTRGYTSYPRTSSQQLPEELGLKKLIEELKRNTHYKALAEKILAQKTIKPNNGKKTDPAHPAIYPTGITPPEGELEGRNFKVYDLIVRRFLATFADAAIRETNKITIDVQGEGILVKGTRTTYAGWQEFYGPHVKLEEQEVPEVQEGDVVSYKDASLDAKETKPPKRYTQSSLIKELEKRNLGTKATRASIIETLFARDYALEKTLEPTEMGIQVVETLERNVPEIVSEELTRHFEEEMEKIREGNFTSEEVLDEAKKELTKIIDVFKQKQETIGTNLKQSLLDSEDKKNTLGTCKKCGNGTLMIKYSPKNKQHFIGCTNYPDCTAVFSLPGDGKNAHSTDKECESCGFPMIRVGSGRSERIACFNPDCPVKKEQEESQMGPHLTEALKAACPNCGEHSLQLRKSFYGQFIGCGNYPKCKTIIQIPKDGGPIPIVAYVSKKKTAKKSSKKTSKKAAKKSTKKSTKKAAKKTTKNANTKK